MLEPDTIISPKLWIDAGLCKSWSDWSKLTKQGAISMLLLLGACTTPKTVLKNEDTGQVVSCGGNTTSSMMLGAVGYYMQKSDDGNCVANYLEQGFDRADR